MPVCIVPLTMGLGHSIMGCVTATTLAIVLAGAPSPAIAQDAPRVSPTDVGVYENRPIDRLIVRGSIDDEGRRTTLTETAYNQALNIITSQEGTVFDAQRVRDDIRRLNRLGLFQRVEIFAGLTEGGGVELAFDLLERLLVADVQVTGNTQLGDAQILEVIDVVAGAPIDRFQIDRSARRIEELYRSKGYYYVRVNIDEKELEETGLVIFRVLEGDRLKVSSIRFQGNTAFSTRKLKRELETRQANLFVRGQLDDQLLDVDIRNLTGFYQNRGYLDVRADRLVQPSPNGREAIVTYLIEEGPIYTLRDIQAYIDTEEDGAPPVMTTEQIAGLIDLSPGDVYAIEKIDDALDVIRFAYGQMGYADVFVTRDELRDEDSPVVDLAITINEGPRSLVGEVIIQGNDLTRQEVIRRQIELRPTRPLDTNALECSKDKLRLLRLFNERTDGRLTPQESGVEFFAQVWDDEFRPTARRPDDGGADADDPITLTLTPPDGTMYRDVLVEVEETNTGSFDIGGAVSSDSGLIGRIALTQRNFDITDTPDSFGEFFAGRAFRGAGQTFQIELQPGNEVQSYSVSLSDPYIFETSYSGSGSIFFRKRDFDEFDETRAGFTLGVGRRFGTRWQGSVNFRYNDIEIGDLEPSRPTDFFAVTKPTQLFGLSASLSRTNLDSRLTPTRGSTTSMSIEQVAGDFTFTPINLRHQIYVPLRDDYLGRSTVLSLSSRIGYIPQGRDNTPTYERYFLGGQNFRGLDFRTVSPRGVRNDNGNPSPDPIGGTWLFYLGAQITQPIYEDILAGVLFIDTGTVTFDPGFDDYRVTAGFGIRLRIPTLSPAPLAFDFGFPIVKQDTDENRVFTFSVDLPLN